jgi:hypothetical protein
VNRPSWLTGRRPDLTADIESAKAPVSERALRAVVGATPDQRLHIGHARALATANLI